MLELKPITAEDVVNEITLPVRREEKRIGFMRPKPGQKVFKFLEGRLTELQPEDFRDDDTLKIANATVGGMQARNRVRKVIINPAALYVPAINYKNALRKLIKAGLLKPIEQW